MTKYQKKIPKMIQINRIRPFSAITKNQKKKKPEMIHFLISAKNQEKKSSR